MINAAGRDACLPQPHILSRPKPALRRDSPQTSARFIPRMPKSNAMYVNSFRACTVHMPNEATGAGSKRKLQMQLQLQLGLEVAAYWHYWPWACLHLVCHADDIFMPTYGVWHAEALSGCVQDSWLHMEGMEAGRSLTCPPRPPHPAAHGRPPRIQRRALHPLGHRAQARTAPGPLRAGKRTGNNNTESAAHARGRRAPAAAGPGRLRARR